jgi:hypothetical protein
MKIIVVVLWVVIHFIVIVILVGYHHGLKPIMLNLVSIYLKEIEIIENSMN